MQPLQNLLNRIRWDRDFGSGRFALGYEDRVADREEVVPFATVRFDADRPGTFSLLQDDGSVVHILLHRVRTVYKNGEPIWQRPGRVAGG